MIDFYTLFTKGENMWLIYFIYKRRKPEIKTGFFGNFIVQSKTKLEQEPISNCKLNLRLINQIPIILNRYKYLVYWTDEELELSNYSLAYALYAFGIKQKISLFLPDLVFKLSSLRTFHTIQFFVFYVKIMKQSIYRNLWSRYFQGVVIEVN